MDWWRRWRPRRPTGRAGARRAGVTALALLAVTTGVAVLLAGRFHVTGAAVAVAILGPVPGLPGLYLHPSPWPAPEDASQGRYLTAAAAGQDPGSTAAVADDADTAATYRIMRILARLNEQEIAAGRGPPSAPRRPTSRCAPGSARQTR